MNIYLKLAALATIVLSAYFMGAGVFDAMVEGDLVSERTKIFFSLGWVIWSGVLLAVFSPVAIAIFGWLKK